MNTIIFLEDIYDAPIWKQYHQLQTAGNMGFTLNTDGINFFRSSSHSAWPCYLENMNLAPAHRQVFISLSKYFKDFDNIAQVLLRKHASHCHLAWSGATRPPALAAATNT